MCGIAGILHLDTSPVNPGDLVKMANTLTHRGPDGSGIALLSESANHCGFHACSDSIPVARGANSGFAHRRLSIIDISDRGIQPMRSESGDLWITYNGEIFNYIELRSELESLGRRFTTATDTEVLLNAYDEWGAGCLDKLNGMWAFAVWDIRRRRLFMARDRFGIKPLYLTRAGHRFAFASEPKALLALDYVSAEPDMNAVADYLLHSRVDCFAGTFFDSIQRLEPGHCLDIGFDDTSIPEPTRWWALSENIASPPGSDSACAEKFLDLLSSSVKLRLRSDVPIGTCLSGGLDSSAVVSIARPWLTAGNQKTYSAVYGPSFDEDESKYIEEAARFADVSNRTVTPKPEDLLADIEGLVYTQDEPFGTTSQYAQYRVFELARKHGTTVTLDGQGADESLAGYHYLFPVYFAGLLKAGRIPTFLREFGSYRAATRASLPSTALATAAGFMSHRAMIRWANRYDPSRNVGWVRGDILNRAATLRPERRFRSAGALNERLHELFTRSGLPALLRYEDRNSMAHSIEARLPFMDHRLVSFVFSLSDEQKIRGGMTKVIMREALKGLVPEKIRSRTDKIGFSTPEAAWFRNEMLPFVRNILDSQVTKKRGLYDVSKLMNLVERNATGKLNAGRTIWRALNLELWFRRFID